MGLGGDGAADLRIFLEHRIERVGAVVFFADDAGGAQDDARPGVLNPLDDPPQSLFEIGFGRSPCHSANARRR